jgi:type IV pilus assembly protein PilB
MADEITHEIEHDVDEASEVTTNEPTADDGPWGRRVRTGQFGRIGTTLIERGLITNEQLDEALDVQRSSGRRVGDILVELGALSAFELARVLADHMGVPFTDLRAKPPDPMLATLLPEEVARRYDALAIARWNEQLVIAMANPTDLFALDDLQMVTRQPIIAAMAVKEDLRAAIDRIYRVSKVETTLDAATSDYNSTDAEQAALQSLEVDEGPVVGLVNALLGQAVTDHASDLHIEPCSTHIAIRFRIDGVLHDSSTVPLELLRPLVSRIKILAGLDIAQNRLAQDGRFSIAIERRSVDVRVVCMPTAAGESVILRLLDPIRDELGISKLGLSPIEHARFLPACFASQGAVFVAGPTGSGKTSTVYSVLSEINTRSKSIVSIEDPVEFRLEGIKQLQINARVGLTFPTTLPTVLRSDPDVVFIGEVRDTETARIAADASITGHLVLSTLHSTSAASTPMRLIEMGVEPYLVASALTLVVSQRLARRLCERCAVSAEPATVDRLRELGATDELLEGAKMRAAVGCPACRGTGYQGRLPIFEIMPITEGISRLILDRASRAQIEGLAVEEGMDTLHLAALRHVVRGELSVEEMVRVIS